MAIPVLTIRSARPRVFYRDTDRAMYQTRLANASGWKTDWDNTILPGALYYKNRSSYTWIATTNPHTRILPVVLAGWLTEDTRVVGGYRDKAIGAALYLCDIDDGLTPTNDRYRSLALALVFDTFYSDLTTAERDKLSAEMIWQMNRASYNNLTERIDGHTANDQKCRLSCILAGYGYGSYTWSTALAQVLTFFYETATGRMETCRVLHADGAFVAGGNYAYLRAWSETWLPWMLSNASDFDGFAAESGWMDLVWEYLLWGAHTGGATFDYEHHNDTARISSPWFINELRWVLAILMTKFPAPNGTQGDAHLRWLYDQWLTRDTQSADSLGFDFVFWDKALPVAVAPEDATTPPARQRLFDPIGVFFARSSWDYDESLVVRISGKDRFELGHRHQDSGCISMNFKGAPLLLSPSGRYDVYDTSPHHGNWYQRTMGQSGTLLVYDPAQTYTFYNKARANDGGQQMKKYLHPTYGELSDPYNVVQMLQDAGGMAWARSTFGVHASSGDHRFLVCDLREAHKKRHTDTSRFSVCKQSFLWIEPTVANGLNYPALLVYHRVVKNNSSWKTCVPWHFRGDVTAQSFGIWGADGGAVGKLWIDLRNPSDYTRTIEGRGSPLDTLSYGPTQFRNYFTGINYPPTVAVGDRHDPWTKRNTWWVEKTVRDYEERYVFLLMADDYAAGEPAASRAWSTDGADPDWYSITLGTVTYGIHRTLDQASFGTVDTTAPAEVTGLSLAARNAALLCHWTDPADADFAEADLQIRTSEIT